MPAALQCPDCGHQEMLDQLGGVTTFRCGGCGRALKVPAQFRGEHDARGGAPGSRPPAPGEQTQALPKVAPGAVPPAALPSVPLVSPGPAMPVMPVMPVAGGPALAGDPPAAPVRAELLRPPLILRLVLWVIALPVGSLLVFGVASWLGKLTRLQLENTFVLTGWGRFLPIARLLPFCALATALIVQLGEFGLERLRARNLRQGPPGRSRPRPGPTRPHAPGGGSQRGSGNGARSRDRVTS
jgi:hypothetical protein